MAGEREPYNNKYCIGRSCADLNGNDMCILEQCVFNEKRIEYYLVYFEILSDDIPVYERVEIR